MSRRLTKDERSTIRGMFGGRCAYCGDELGTHWHADHVKPVIRGIWSAAGTIEHPENDRLSNLMPACPRCNISKGRMTLEQWRGWIVGHVRSLNEHHPIYRVVKAFGLVI